MSITPLVDWIKANKIATLTILFLLVFIGYKELSGWVGVQQLPYGEEYGRGVTYEGVSIEAKPATKERLVVEESNLSLVVKDVSQTAEEVVVYAEKEGGFMVSSSITSPEESPVATVIVRVPSQKLKTTVEYFRSLAIKVSSENLLGWDVTEEYEDIEEKIATLEETIARFEEIRAKATKVSELLEVTREIINLQEQIDSYKGRKEYLEDTVAFSKITVYLATDEFALPYQPPAGFRPVMVFKQAVRSLLTALYAGGKALIWIGVYGVLWVPALAVVIILKRRKRSSRRS